MQLGREELDGLVEDGVGQEVVAHVEAGDAAQVVLGDGADGVEDLDEDLVWQSAQEVVAVTQVPVPITR